MHLTTTRCHFYENTIRLWSSFTFKYQSSDSCHTETYTFYNVVPNTSCHHMLLVDPINSLIMPWNNEQAHISICCPLTFLPIHITTDKAWILHSLIWYIQMKYFPRSGIYTGITSSTQSPLWSLLPSIFNWLQLFIQHYTKHMESKPKSSLCGYTVSIISQLSKDIFNRRYKSLFFIQFPIYMLSTSSTDAQFFLFLFRLFWLIFAKLVTYSSLYISLLFLLLCVENIIHRLHN